MRFVLAATVATVLAAGALLDAEASLAGQHGTTPGPGAGIRRIRHAFARRAAPPRMPRSAWQDDHARPAMGRRPLTCVILICMFP